MTPPQSNTFLPDTNVLVAAHRSYYASDLCPGFWDCLAHYFAGGRLLIIDRVYDEIVSPVELVEWVEQATNYSFPTTATQPVADAYRRLIGYRIIPSLRMPPVSNLRTRQTDGWPLTPWRTTQ